MNQAAVGTVSVLQLYITNESGSSWDSLRLTTSTSSMNQPAVGTVSVLQLVHHL